MKRKINIGNKIIGSEKRTGLFVLGLFIAFFMYCGKEVKAECVTADILHVHTGDDVLGGGCYAEEILCHGNTVCVAEAIQCGRQGKTISQREWLCEAGHIDTNSAGDGYYEYQHSARCDYITGSRNVFVCDTCGMRYSEYIEVCNAVTGYKNTCGFVADEKIGELRLTADTGRYVQKMNVKAEVTGDKDLAAKLLQNATWSCDTGDILGQGNEITVSKNGEYTIFIAAGNNTAPVKAGISINCIDNTPPVITAFYMPYALDKSYVTIGVNAEDNTTGNAALRYVFCEGACVIEPGVARFSENGHFSVSVYDEAGNAVRKDFSVDGIIKPVPKEGTKEMSPDMPGQENHVQEIEVEKNPEKQAEEKKEEKIEEKVEEKIEETVEANPVPNEKEQMKEQPKEQPEKQPEKQAIVPVTDKITFPVVSILQQPVEIDQPKESRVPSMEETVDEVMNEPVQDMAEKTPEVKHSIRKVKTKAAGYIGVIIGVSAMLTGCYMLFTKGRCLLHNEKKSDKITMNIN